MKKYTLFIGLNDQHSKVQQINTIEAYKIVTNICMQHTSGATISESVGYFKHEDGSVVVEKSLRVELIFIELKDVLSIISAAKVVLNQESILLQEDNIQSSFI